MGSVYHCRDSERRRHLRAQPSGPKLNGIDYLVVMDDEEFPLELRQRILLVRLFNGQHLEDGGENTITPGKVRIEGGVRVVDPDVSDVVRASDFDVSFAPGLTPELVDRIEDHIDHVLRWLVILVAERGDHSTYRLKLRDSAETEDPPPGFDPRESEIAFSFKVACPSPLDCGTETVCVPAVAEPPAIDYLARDYRSFRRLLLDRLALTQPEDETRTPADLRTALVELLAYAGDHEAYHQDAAATEAYLGTARRRVSVRRHARLLDYAVDEGANARAWVHLRMAPGAELVASDPPLIAKCDLEREGRPGVRFLTRLAGRAVVIPEDDWDEVHEHHPQVFEPMHDVRHLSDRHNEIPIYTWGDGDCCLPAGSTALTLREPGGTVPLEEGDLLLLEEIRGADTGLPADADPTRRRVVRLTEVVAGTDPLYGVDVLDVRWDARDALPFPLCVSAGGEAVAVARGNILLVDHGRTSGESLDLVSYGAGGALRARLQRRELTWCRAEPESDGPASAAFDTATAATRPAVVLRDADDVWKPQADLLDSGAHAREFVAEMETDGRAWLRFGDGVLGRTPEAGVPLRATYRVGRGFAGNVGADAIAHVVLGGSAVPADQILAVRNPIAATGGTAPESLEAVRQYAPQAFRRQERAVTEADWTEVMGRHDEVQRALATVEWTGSWHVVVLVVDRIGGRISDPAERKAFRERMRAWAERYRLAGYEVVVRDAAYVPLDIVLTVCVAEGALAPHVKDELLDRFGSRIRKDGTKAFFHPDRFTFGQSVYLSQIVAEAMTIPGVAWVDTSPSPPGRHRFRRRGAEPRGELAAGVLPVDRLEIIQCDSDPNAPENGQIRFRVEGGA